MRYERTPDGDRPAAYPPTQYQQGPMTDWQPPSWNHILKDLGLRLVEVAIAASFMAIGEEVAYFFRSRRFYPAQPPPQPQYPHPPDQPR